MLNIFEQRVHELENRYQLLADNLFDAIWVVDVETMTYDYITPSVQRISGLKSEELIGSPISARMPKESVEEMYRVLNEARLQTEKGANPIRTLELELIHKDGHPYWVEIKAKFLKEEGKPLKIVGVTRDITLRKNAELKQNELIRKLNEALAEKQRLLRENKMLRDILPICSGCKRIRDENNRWWPLDVFVERHTKSKFSHTICPDCRSVIYDES